LIQPEWPARALLMAEMENRGHEVLAADSVTMARDLCTRRGFRPELLVVDMVGLSLEEADARTLSFLRGQAPLLMIGSSQYGDPMVTALAPSRQLVRPLTVGEIADAAADLVRGAS